MNGYENSTPRAAIGIAAVAMTALSIGLMVVAPAKLEPGNREAVTIAAPAPDKPAAIEVAISPAKVDVLGIRDPDVAAVQHRNLPARRRQQG